LLASLAADMDDSFYFAHKELDKLFFHDERLQLEYSDLRNRILAETPQSSYSCFKEFLANDRIDFFFLGDFNEVEIQNVLDGDEQHLSMIVMNGLLGGFAHSKLFTNVRENAGLAYTISSQLDLFSGFLRMYAGIDRENRNQARKMMNNQLLDLKKGYFTELELEQTKEMIRRSLLLSQDNQGSLIERAYQNSLLGKSSADFKGWIAKLEQVDKDAICRAANNVKLQAIYFMEGIE